MVEKSSYLPDIMIIDLGFVTRDLIALSSMK